MSVLRPASLIREYDEFSSFDPAFQFDESDAARNNEIRVARETSDWSKHIRQGATPVKYVMRRLDSVWREVMDRLSLPDGNPRHIGFVTATALLFRLACVRIVGGPEGTEGQLARLPDPRWDGWPMIPASVVDALDALDPRIVTELGAAVLDRVRASPK